LFLFLLVWLQLQSAISPRLIRGHIQNFPDLVDNENNNDNKRALRSNTNRFGEKLTRLTHKIAIPLHLVQRTVPFAAGPDTVGYTLVVHSVQ
jgi:hypothetical protein